MTEQAVKRPKVKGQNMKARRPRKLEAFDQSLSEMLEEILHKKNFFPTIFSKKWHNESS